MLLRVRQQEYQQKAARRRHRSSIVKFRAKEYQRMRARKIFDEMMQEANAWRLDAEVAAVGVMESESDIAYTDSSQASVAV